MTKFDMVVVGAGLRGLRAGLRSRAQAPGARLLIVEAQAWPGGDVRTQRSNGFACELGPFAFTREEISPTLDLLEQPPRILDCNRAGHTGWLFDGEQRHELAVEPDPCSFATGCEDLVQACRRELNNDLRLGRTVTSIQPDERGGFVITLGGEVPTELHTDAVTIATTPTCASRILDAFDPELARVAEHEQLDQRAFVWFGGLQKDTPELRGYGVLPHPELDSPLAELIFCTEVFTGRAIAERTLVRAETALAELPSDDAELTQMLEAELRRWTNTSAPFGFTKVHRFTTTAPDGIAVECRTRLVEIVKRVPGLSIAT